MNEQIRFLVTRELGKLAKWLRIIGFDAVYSPDTLKSHIYIAGLRENRIILTRNKRLGGRQGIRTVFISGDFLTDQLRQVVAELNLSLRPENFFQRCVLCNRELAHAEKESIRPEVPEYVFQTQDVFFKCSGCGRVYWKGTHWGNVEKMLRIVRNEEPLDGNNR